jgi:peroxiredoxin
MRQVKMMALALAIPLLIGAWNANAGDAKIGEPAPAFSVQDSTGKKQSLADQKGKYVVLEWTNPGCPYVVKHYATTNMQAIIKTAQAKGAVWFTVSTGKGKTDWAKRLADTGATPNGVLLDADAALAKAYGAKCTPHLFVIAPDGKLIYDGAIDDKPTANKDDVNGAKNYVLIAIEEALAGKPVTTAKTKPYGCGVHY